MSQINLYGRIISGKLEVRNRSSLDQWVRNQEEGDEIVLKIRTQKDLKSTRQIRLLYHCFRELSSKLGYTVEEVKAFLKFKSGLCFFHTIEGVEINVCKSISDMTRSEISEFIQFIDKWSSETLSLPLLNNEDLNFLKS